MHRDTKRNSKTKLKSKRLLLTSMAAATAAASSFASAQAPSPYEKPDDAWITISGTVHDVTADSFVLDYGSSRVIVEMDDGDRDADAYDLLPGDLVTVNGAIDRDFLESTSIEAHSVFLPKLDTYFFSSAADEEDALGWYNLSPEPDEIIAQGTVSWIGEDEFTVNRDSISLRVSTETMATNPLDDMGYHKVRVGDRVQISGDLERSIEHGVELYAESIITLAKSSGRRPSVSLNN